MSFEFIRVWFLLLNSLLLGAVISPLCVAEIKLSHEYLESHRRRNAGVIDISLAWTVAYHS